MGSAPSAAAFVIERRLAAGVPAAIARVKESLAREGFGVLSEIDLASALREKLGVQFEAYTILGVCHPPSAYQAVSIEESIGVFLPCNVVVHAAPGGSVIRAIRPGATLSIVGNPALTEVGRTVEAMLERAVAAA